MKIAFDNIGDLSATFLSHNAEKGNVVTMYSPKTVTPASDASDFVGVCTFSDGGAATVKVKGFVTVSYTGSMVAPGVRKIICSGPDSIRLAADEEIGREVLVVDADSAAKIATILL